MTLISATGLKRSRRLRGRQSGFTIAEILIVLALVGLAAQAVVLVLPSDARALRQEVETFAARVKAAQDVAIFNNAALFGVVDSFGYRFEQGIGDARQALNSDTLQPAQWSPETSVLLSAGGRTRIQLSALGTITPTQFQFSRGDARLTVALDYDGAIEVRRD